MNIVEDRTGISIDGIFHSLCELVPSYIYEPYTFFERLTVRRVATIFWEKLTFIGSCTGNAF
jgi:hypothetical protein